MNINKIPNLRTHLQVLLAISNQVNRKIFEQIRALDRLIERLIYQLNLSNVVAFFLPIHRSSDINDASNSVGDEFVCLV